MKSRPIFPTTEQIRELPPQHSMTIPSHWEDRNGHVNVQFYQALYELGGYQVLAEVDADEAYLQEHGFGMFDLEHHLHYRSEVLVGDRVSTYNRLLVKNDRRFHGMYLIVNDSRDQLACTLEYITAAVNLGLRRTTAFPPDMSRAIALQLSRHQELSWPAPVCGALKVK